MLKTAKYGLIALGLLACGMTAAGTPRPALAADTSQHEERDAFARNFADKVLAILQDPKKSYGDRKTILREAFSKSVDIDWIAKFVLGKHWNEATQEQKDRYSSLYRKFLTETYVANFAENPDRRIADIKIFSVNDVQEDDFTVRTEMKLADMERLKVDYLVHDSNAKYKVRDIAIENVSLITTHRAEFTELAAAKGINGVIAKLEEATGGNKFAMNGAQ